MVVDGNTKSIISHGLGHGVLHYLSVTQGGLSRSEPLITRETPWYVAAGLLLSSFGLFFDLLERTEFPPWLKTTQAVASALLVPTTVPLIMARTCVEIKYQTPHAIDATSPRSNDCICSMASS